MTSVFLSHNSADKPLVRRLARDLVLHGVRVWLDEAELLVGDSLLSRVSTAIIEMDYLAVILTRKSVKSNWVRRELEIAMSGQLESNKIKVLPILADDCDIPAFLHGLLYINMTTEAQYLIGLQQLIRRLLPNIKFSPYEKITSSKEGHFAWIRSAERRYALQSSKAADRIKAVRDVSQLTSLGIPIALELLSDRSKKVKEVAYETLEKCRDKFDSDYFENDQRLFGKNSFDEKGQTLVYAGDYYLLQFLNLYLEDNTLPRQTLESLATCIDASDCMIRALAIFCLARTRTSFSMSQVISSSMLDEDDLVREVAVWGVAEFSKVFPNQLRLQNSLLISATDTVGDIRLQVIEGLRFHAGHNVVQCLVGLSSDINYDVRKSAMKVLVEREEEEAYIALTHFFLRDEKFPVTEQDELIRVYVLNDISHHSAKRSYESMLINLLGQERYANAFERPNYPAKQVLASAISALKTQGTHKCIPVVRRFESVRETIKTYTDFSSGAYWEFNIAEDIKEIMDNNAGKYNEKDVKLTNNTF